MNSPQTPTVSQLCTYVGYQFGGSYRNSNILIDCISRYIDDFIQRNVSWIQQPFSFDGPGFALPFLQQQGMRLFQANGFGAPSWPQDNEQILQIVSAIFNALASLKYQRQQYEVLRAILQQKSQPLVRFQQNESQICDYLQRIHSLDYHKDLKDFSKQWILSLDAPWPHSALSRLECLMHEQDFYFDPDIEDKKEKTFLMLISALIKGTEIETQTFGKEFKILKDRVLALMQNLTVRYFNRGDIEHGQDGFRKTGIFKEQWNSFRQFRFMKQQTAKNESLSSETGNKRQKTGTSVILPTQIQPNMPPPQKLAPVGQTHWLAMANPILNHLVGSCIQPTPFSEQLRPRKIPTPLQIPQSTLTLPHDRPSQPLPTAGRIPSSPAQQISNIIQSRAQGFIFQAKAPNIGRPSSSSSDTPFLRPVGRPRGRPLGAKSNPLPMSTQTKTTSYPSVRPSSEPASAPKMAVSNIPTLPSSATLSDPMFETFLSTPSHITGSSLSVVSTPQPASLLVTSPGRDFICSSGSMFGILTPSHTTGSSPSVISAPLPARSPITSPGRNYTSSSGHMFKTPKRVPSPVTTISPGIISAPPPIPSPIIPHDADIISISSSPSSFLSERKNSIDSSLQSSPTLTTIHETPDEQSSTVWDSPPPIPSPTKLKPISRTIKPTSFNIYIRKSPTSNYDFEDPLPYTVFKFSPQISDFFAGFAEHAKLPTSSLTTLTFVLPYMQFEKMVVRKEWDVRAWKAFKRRIELLLGQADREEGVDLEVWIEVGDTSKGRDAHEYDGL